MAAMGRLCQILSDVKAELQYHYDLHDCMHRGSDYCLALSTFFDILLTIEKKYCKGREGGGGQ